MSLEVEDLALVLLVDFSELALETYHAARQLLVYLCEVYQVLLVLAVQVLDLRKQVGQRELGQQRVLLHVLVNHVAHLRQFHQLTRLVRQNAHDLVLDQNLLHQRPLLLLLLFRLSCLLLWSLLLLFLFRLSCLLLCSTVLLSLLFCRTRLPIGIDHCYALVSD